MADLDKLVEELSKLTVIEAAELSHPEQIVRRYTDDQLEDLEEFPIREPRDRDRKKARKRWELRKKVRKFFVEEKALATVEPSSRPGGLIRLGALAFFFDLF